MRQVGLASLLVVGVVLPAGAQEYADVALPDSVRVTVSYSAGGSSDALARATAPYWETCVEELAGQSISTVVTNLPGAGGEIGWNQLATSAADGGTIGIINLPAVPLVQAARDAQFEPWLESFTPIGVNVIDPNVVRVSNQSDFATLEEAVQAAIDEPGSVVVGADGPLSDDHLAAYALSSATGATFAFVPYSGGAPANRAFQAGEVDLAVGNVFDYLATEDSTADAGIFWNEPYESIPDVEPVGDKLDIEVPEIGSTRGFAAPSGLPAQVLALYRDAFECAVTNEEYVAQARERNITLVEPRIGEDFGDVMRNQAQAVDDLLKYFVEGGYIDG